MVCNVDPTSDSITITIIMANYNGAPFIADAIASVCSQTYGNWELIIVDDASTDHSIDIIEAAAGADSRIRLIRSSNRAGPSAARNRALDAMRGDWVAIADSDDLMSSDRLYQLLSIADRTKARIVADNQVLFWDGDTRHRLFITRHKLQQERIIGFHDFVLSNSIGAKLPPLGFIKPLIHRRLIDITGIRYDTRLKIGEDFDFIARLLANGEKMLLTPLPFYFYRKHPNSISHRFSPETLQALLLADEQFRTEFPNLAKAELQVLDARRRGLQTFLHWEELMSHLKSGRITSAARLPLYNRGLWPMLANLVAERVARLGRTLARAHKHHGPLD